MQFIVKHKTIKKIRPIQNLDNLLQHKHMKSQNEIKNILWDRVGSDDYEDPPKSWIPEDVSMRFEWEPDSNIPKQLTKSKGRTVILKAKKGWEKAFDDDNTIQK